MKQPLSSPSFIGRDEQIDFYHHFLSQPSPWLLLVTGMPGCGKSFFLKHIHLIHMKKDDPKNNIPTAYPVYLDFADISLQTDPFTLLSEFSWRCAEFCDAEAVDKFRQELQTSRLQLVQRYTEQLKFIPDQLQQQAPGSANLELLLSEDNKEDVELNTVQDALLKQLATLPQDKHLVVMFDTCEWLTEPTRQRVKTWLLEQFLPNLHEQCPCHVVMACRTPIPLSETLKRQSPPSIELRELEESAAIEYSIHKIRMPEEVGRHIYSITHGHPLCFSIMIKLWQEEKQEDSVITAKQGAKQEDSVIIAKQEDSVITVKQEENLTRLENKYSEHALVELVQERLDQRLPSPYREWTHYGILLRSFNKEMLSKVFSELPCNDEDYDHFVHSLYVQSKGESGQYAIHELLREVLFEIVRRQEPDAWQRYHQRARDFYRRLPAPQSYEQYYHAVALDEIHGLKQWIKELQGASIKRKQQPSIDLLFQSATDGAMQLRSSSQALYKVGKKIYELQEDGRKERENLQKQQKSYREKGDQAAAIDAEEARHQLDNLLTQRLVRPWWYILAIFSMCIAIISLPVIPFLLFHYLPFPNQVTNLADDGPGSLRDVITKTSSGSTITFSPQLQGIIVLGKGDLNINKNVTVDASNIQPITISNYHNQNVHIHIGVKATVTFINFIFANSLVQNQSFLENEGKLTLRHCRVQNNISYDNGGGITNNGGTVTIDNSTITNNFASSSGGGIYNLKGTLTTTESIISSNTAFENGGGIYGVDGSVNIGNNTQILRNQILNNTNSKGGGIVALDSNLSITGSTITQNWTPGTGGGISMLGSQGIISKSVISDNMAKSGREIAVENDSENNKGCTLNLTNLVLPPYEGHPKYYIGNSQDKIEDIIKGNLTNTTIVSIPSDKSILGNPASTVSFPENSPDYVGNIDPDRYCQAHYSVSNAARSFDATNPFELACIDTNKTRHGVDPLQVCQEQYPGKNITTDRLVDYFDPTSWQCYANTTLLGHAGMIDHADAFCRFNDNLNIANNPRKTAYDWKCLHQGGTIGHYPIHLDNFQVGLSVADLCQFVYAKQIAPASIAMDRLINYNDPEGWECWELQAPPTT